MKIEFLSASGANVYEQCALRYYAKYILGKKSGVTPAIGAGLIAHKALELYYRPDFNMHLDECFKKASTEEFCPDRDQFEAAKEMFYNLAKEEPKESTNTITTELDFKFYLESGAAARGFIDRVDLENGDTIRIVDYKTGEFVPPVDELETGHQTNIYAAYIFLDERFSGINNVIFNYKYLRKGQQKSIKITRDMAYKYLEYFDHLFQAIKNDESPKPTMNTFCWNCEHRGECNEYRNAISVVCSLKSACGLGSDKISNTDELQDLSPEEMVDVFNAISTISTCLDKEKKVVSSWVVSMLKNVSGGKIESNGHVAKLSSRKVSFVDGRSARDLVVKYNLVDRALQMLSAGDLEILVGGNADAKHDYEKIVMQRDGASFPTTSKKK